MIIELGWKERGKIMRKKRLAVEGGGGARI